MTFGTLGIELPFTLPLLLAKLSLKIVELLRGITCPRDNPLTVDLHTFAWLECLGGLRRVGDLGVVLVQRSRRLQRLGLLKDDVADRFPALVGLDEDGVALVAPLDDFLNRGPVGLLGLRDSAFETLFHHSKAVLVPVHLELASPL